MMIALFFPFLFLSKVGSLLEMNSENAIIFKLQQCRDRMPL